MKNQRLIKFFSPWVIALFILAVGIAGIASSQPASSDWPVFRHDVGHTGRSPYLGAQTGVLKWSYLPGGDVESSQAIGADGTIYFGS